MSEIKLVAESRTEFGKGAARRLRRADKVPAVVYGHGTDPVHVALPAHDTMLALKHSNALLTIALDGADKLVMVKDIQRDPVRRIIEHVDLLLVRQGEKVGVEIPVRVIGEAAPGTNHMVEQLTLHIEADATRLPESIEVDVTGLVAGTVVYARDLVLPEGANLVTDPDADVVIISEVRTEAAEDETSAGA